MLDLMIQLNRRADQLPKMEKLNDLMMSEADRITKMVQKEQSQVEKVLKRVSSTNSQYASNARYVIC